MFVEELPLWISIIGNFGFPIALTIYLFVRFERKIEELEKVIIELSTVIRNFSKKKLIKSHKKICKEV